MSSTHLERLNAEIAQITQPLLDHYEEISKEVKAKEQEVIQLRKARSQLRAVIRGINPELIPSTYKSSSNGKKTSKPSDFSAERLAQITEWLQAHKEELNASGGFHASGLNDRPDFDFISHQSGISKALIVLHEQGVIRLDHRGHGGAKYFKVI